MAKAKKTPAGKKTAKPPKAAKPLKLYFVETLVDNAQPDQQDFEAVLVWAPSPKTALADVIEALADEGGPQNEEQRADLVRHFKELAENNSAVAELAPSVLQDVKLLLAGPTGKLSPAARKDLERVQAILAKYKAAKAG